MDECNVSIQWLYIYAAGTWQDGKLYGSLFNTSGAETFRRHTNASGDDYVTYKHTNVYCT